MLHTVSSTTRDSWVLNVSNGEKMRFILAAITLTTATTQVYADWQYTNWSMNRQQVEAAVAQQGVEILPPFVPAEQQDPNASVVAFRAPYTAGGINFNALFAFDRSSNRLDSVRLVVQEAHRCDALRSGLLEKYGTPEGEIDKIRSLVKQKDITWRDTSNNNYLRLNDYIAMGQRGCSVEYKPLQSASTKGL